ncbi:glycosyltransferase, group 1 family protein [Roseburia intestinalis L1-82]|nr:GT4 family glycosyltransferase PelF [Roseburia intestinalis]EEV02061.1 glycosyltransferase, group 1 family protein [Roseburia intestinalis L1-82]
MIRAFAYAKKEAPKLALWIMGPSDEEKEYAKECFELVDLLGVEDVIFTGKVDVTEYLGKMDMTILTSISEGQPLTILESFAAKKPVIATDVGNCRGLIYGEGDSFGEAGIITHIMNVEEIAAAMVDLACHREKRIGMGKNGYRRLKSRYLVEDMKETYRQIYRQFEDEGRVQGKKGDV